jgi:hypothetical protein
MNWLPTREEAVDTLREQALSCRRLALRARSQSGSDALSAVARQFEEDAEHVSHFREPTTVRFPDGDAAALVRLRLALERQTAEWLQRRPMPSRASEA